MNTSTTTSSEASLAKRRFRKLRFALIALGAFCLTVVIFYAEEDWRGKRAWEDCKHELEAKGAVLDWNKLIPPPVPDDQNLFKAPKMTEWFVRHNRPYTNELTERLANPRTSSVSTATNLITSATGARDSLAWSSQFEPDFDLLREALKRPYARMDGNYAVPSEGPVPNFVCVRAVAQTLAQRAHCYLLLGEPGQALPELTLMHDMRHLLECAPTGKPITLIAAMINVQVAGFYTDVIADGLQKHVWQEPQLVALQSQLADTKLAPDVVEGFRVEQSAVSGYRLSDVMLYDKTNLWQKLESKAFWLFDVAPRGWTYQNMAVAAHLYQKLCNSVDLSNDIMSPKEIDTAISETEHTRNSSSPFVLLGRMIIPNFSRATQVTSHNQAMINEAQIACALERYKLANGNYPETLDALAPQFIEKIPHDIIGGQPLHYRRTSDGKFLLYSVGWNETDDGGQISTATNKWGQPDFTQGDWVWKN
jgi:hypothetical protein